VESLREVFKKVVTDIETAWGKVKLGLPDVINLSAISIAEDGGMKELRDIALNSSKFAYIKAVGADGMEQAIFRAEGGYVSGPGTSTSDSIPAQLSNGEYVIKASTVKKLGLNMLNSLNQNGDLNSVISSQGRFGDTKAAHLNSKEMDLLKKVGGSGTRNPVTGMLEFFGGASSGANAYGGLFAKEEEAYLNKIQSKFPNGNPSLNDGSIKANWIDTRKIGNTFVNSVGDPVDLLNLRGRDIMDTSSYDAMQNQMLSSTMILNTLGNKRGLKDINSQTQGFGLNSYKAPKERSGLSKFLSALAAFAIGAVTFGLGAPIALAALATAGTGVALNSASQAKAGEKLREDKVLNLYKDVNAQDLGRGGYRVNNYTANKLLFNDTKTYTGAGLFTTAGQLGTELNSRYDTAINAGLFETQYSRANSTLEKINVVKNKPSLNAKNTRSIVDAFNAENGMFFDFYMLDNPQIPNYQKANYSAKNNSTGGLAKYMDSRSSILNSNISGPRDSIPAMLEPGEFVLRKPAVDRMGIDTAIRLNSTGNVDSDVNVEVNVINNSSPVTPTIQQTRRENGKIVVDVILEDVRNNGPIRQAIRGIK
jgi:hypothetical protein